MSLSVLQSKTALAANNTASFLGVGGVEPYIYSVLTGGAGGSVNSSTGVYQAPVAASSDVAQAYDTIQVEDASAQTQTATILVGTPLLLLCEIIQREMNLANGRVYLWDQKIFQPKDRGLYVVISMARAKPFANVNGIVPTLSGMTQEQFVCVMATLDINILSRGPEALDRKEEVLLALGSVYSEQQQSANSFNIGRIPPSGQFINLSNLDGAAIPYRFNISINMQYAYAKPKIAPYYDDFATPDLIVNN